MKTPTKIKTRTVLFHSIKLNSAVYDLLQLVLGDVNKRGWKHIGATRSDRPTMSTLVEEAINRLYGKRV